MRLLAPALIAVTMAVPAAAAAQKQTETVDRTISVGNSGRLTLKNFSGDVRVSGTEGSDIVVHAVRRATRERLDNIKLDIKSSGSSVSIEANRRDSNWRDRNDNVVETEFDIKVPFGTELDLYSFSGKLQVTGVSGTIDAETFSGDVELDIARADRVPSLNVETFSGDIRAKVSSSASGRVQFNSFSGDVDSDLPIAMRTSRRRNVNGEIGSGGGPMLKFKTFSGDLRILK
ncbi:MAG: DUF4097 family beta strand repeat-containing protein [Vicinamibacterales bacterium]